MKIRYMVEKARDFTIVRKWKYGNMCILYNKIMRCETAVLRFNNLAIISHVYIIWKDYESSFHFFCYFSA
jgi:hypothetical protein